MGTRTIEQINRGSYDWDDSAEGPRSAMGKINENFSEIDADLSKAEENIEILQGKNTSGDRSILIDTFSRADTESTPGSDYLGSPEIGALGEAWKCYDVSPWPPGAHRIEAVSVNAGGSGYTVGDILDVVGGTYTPPDPGKLQVTAVDGSGAVAGVSIYNSTGYYVDPANPVSVTGGTGTGAQFDLTLNDYDAKHQYVYIKDGALRTQIGQTTYLVRDLPYAPNVISAEVEWVDGNDSGAPEKATFAIACGTKETGDRTNTMIHCTLSRSAMEIETAFYDGRTKLHAVRPFITGQIEKNKKYKVVFSFDQGVATLRLGEYSITADHPDIGRWHGTAVYWEQYYPAGTTLSSTDVAIHSVSCEVGLGAGPQFSAKTGVVNIPRARQLIFNGGTDSVIATTSSLGSIAASDYSIFWKGTVLPHQRAFRDDWMGLWMISNEATGQQYGHGPSLYLQNTIFGVSGWQLTYVFYNGGNANIQGYGFEPQGSFKNKTIDVLATRDVDENKGEIYLNGAYLAPELLTSAGTKPEWSDTFPQPSNYLHIGQGNIAYEGNGWQGGIETCAMFNMVVQGDDLAQIRRGYVPERLKWATNVALSAATSLPAEKCFRLGAVGTTDYWFDDCEAGDEVQLLVPWKVSAIAVSAAGTGYLVNDVLTVSGGTAGDAVTARVTTIGGSGEVTGLALQHKGNYWAKPSNPASTTGGAGAGCTVTLTWDDAYFLNLKDWVAYKANKLITDASNTCTQIGCMGWWDGSIGNGQQMVDISSNRLHGSVNGSITMSQPESADRPVVSADAGDADYTHTPDGRPVHTVRYDTTLTANRTVTLSATGSIKGDVVKVVRTGLGAFTLDVGGLKTIASGTAATVEATFDGSAWVLTGYGAL